MKAAVVQSAGAAPVYAEFTEPAPRDGCHVLQVRASALSQLTRGRAGGGHYSAGGAFPLVAGADGVGVTSDGQRVYFALPEHPFGAMAERSLVQAAHCVPIPDTLEDGLAAAIANPGMSACAALVERARIVPGETVLINGATGTAGRLAVQLAKFLGAGRVVATGRNPDELAKLRELGAEETVPFTLGTDDPHGTEQYEEALIEVFKSGVDVVLDYLWGTSARCVLAAIAKGVESTRPVRFVHVGGASGEGSIDLPGAALRSSPVVLMGSGLKSVPLPAMLNAVRRTFEAVVPAGLRIATQSVALSEVERFWSAPGKPRIVFTLP